MFKGILNKNRLAAERSVDGWFSSAYSTVKEIERSHYFTGTIKKLCVRP